MIKYFKKIIRSRIADTGFWGIVLLYSLWNLTSKLDILLHDGFESIFTDYRFYIGFALYLLILYFFISSYIQNFGWKYKADIAFKNGDIKKAKEYYDILTKIFRWNGHYIADRGNCYYKMSEWQLAINDYTKALKLEPDSVYIYKNRAYAYKMLGFRKYSANDTAKVKQLEKMNK